MIRAATCLALVAATHAADPDTQGTRQLSLPESVLQDAGSGVIYCSSIGGKEPTAAAVTGKDGDGFISVLQRDGTVADLRHLPVAGDAPLNGPKGMCLLGASLWVADIDRVVGFDLKTRKEQGVIDLAPLQVSFANDLVAIDDHRMVASDTASGKVLVIEPGNHEHAVTTFDPPLEIEGANGVALDGQRNLLVAQYSFAGKMLRVSRMSVDWTTLHHSQPEVLPFPDGQWDGLAVAKDGTIYASDWTSGAIWALAANAKEAQKLEGGDGFKGPADFCLLSDESAIVCPDLVEQRVKVIKLGKKK